MFVIFRRISDDFSNDALEIHSRVNHEYAGLLAAAGSIHDVAAGINPLPSRGPPPETTEVVLEFTDQINFNNHMFIQEDGLIKKDVYECISNMFTERNKHCVYRIGKPPIAEQANEMKERSFVSMVTYEAIATNNCILANKFIEILELVYKQDGAFSVSSGIYSRSSSSWYGNFDCL